MTLKELYETIKKKRESAERNKKITEINLIQKSWSDSEKEELDNHILVLYGEIEAYTDVICLIESSDELDERP